MLPPLTKMDPLRLKIQMTDTRTNAAIVETENAPAMEAETEIATESAEIAAETRRAGRTETRS